MASQFINKVAIVTGSSSGFGEVIAVMFASRGAKVTVCGRDADRLKEAFDNVVAAGGGHRDNFLMLQGDLNDQTFRKQIVEQTVEKFGRLDIVVANAGIVGIEQSILNASEETYNAVMDTNLKATFFLIQQAVPHLEKTKGNIINISSVVSGMSIPGMTVYCMSKIALDHLTRILAKQLGPNGIRANTINPGYIVTRVFRYLNVTDESHVDFTNKEIESQALCNRVGTSDDVAEAVAFLASDAAGFITGEHIRLDGGRILNGPIDLQYLKQNV